MITGTFLALLFIPLFYVLVMKLFRTKEDRGAAPAASNEAAPAEGR
jgi:hypothetical protein